MRSAEGCRRIGPRSAGTARRSPSLVKGELVAVCGGGRYAGGSELPLASRQLTGRGQTLTGEGARAFPEGKAELGRGVSSEAGWGSVWPRDGPALGEGDRAPAGGGIASLRARPTPDEAGTRTGEGEPTPDESGIAPLRDGPDRPRSPCERPEAAAVERALLGVVPLRPNTSRRPRSTRYMSQLAAGNPLAGSSRGTTQQARVKCAPQQSGSGKRFT